jgi:KUP system potassium uptake protein
LYSILCRQARIAVSQNHAPEDSEVSSYLLPTPTRQVKRAARMKEALQRSGVLRTLLLGVAVLGTCMVIGDGVLTPSISGTYN